MVLHLLNPEPVEPGSDPIKGFADPQVRPHQVNVAEVEDLGHVQLGYQELAHFFLL